MGPAAGAINDRAVSSLWASCNDAGLSGCAGGSSNGRRSSAKDFQNIRILFMSATSDCALSSSLSSLSAFVPMGPRVQNVPQSNCEAFGLPSGLAQSSSLKFDHLLVEEETFEEGRSALVDALRHEPT
jgi:hypothetical protein